MNKKLLGTIAESTLKNVDNIGFQLDAMGIENRINRHNLIALVMQTQQRIQGEVDSANARFDASKIKVESVIDSAEKTITSGVELVTFPASYAVKRVKELA